ncbi:hypothetical protein NE237_027161 [Protea cynaroides]|uniref:Uncharacterized protein n=1 Tax=Protea cynaroides TaxID=273540 RepID=A0A9Q0JRM6_9MAGN|nr:hypothetical protein NE237_027161 [Protea cynaroides]
MSNRKGTSRGKNRTGDEVEELLLAAQDDLLLNLNLNSHITHASSSSSPIDHDLSRRLEALKSSKTASVPPPQPQPQQKVKSTSDSTGITKVPLPEKQQKEKSKEEEELERVLGADLSARFAALKGSSSSSKTFTESQECPVRSDGGNDTAAADDDDEVDEVDKLIQWAIDAARLDPSSPTDDDDCEEDDDDDCEEDDDDNEDEEKDHRRKQQQKK